LAWPGRAGPVLAQAWPIAIPEKARAGPARPGLCLIGPCRLKMGPAWPIFSLP